MNAPLHPDKQAQLKLYANRVGFAQACKVVRLAPATFAKAAAGFPVAITTASHLDLHLPPEPPQAA